LQLGYSGADALPFSHFQKLENRQSIGRKCLLGLCLRDCLLDFPRFPWEALLPKGSNRKQVAVARVGCAKLAGERRT
jgi:hypothetical protein